MGEKERKLTKERLKNLKPNERLFRINAGMGWTANPKQIFRANRPMSIRVSKGDMILRQARTFHGAPTGWPDLCGWTETEITPEMVGKKVAIFTFEEVKATGKLSTAQEKFKEIIVRMGGIFRTVKN